MTAAQEIPDVLKRPMLRKGQIDTYHDEVVHLKQMLKDPTLENPGEIVKIIGRVENTLHEYTPPDITGENADVLSRMSGELKTSMLHGMPSGEEMRKNPPGAVGRHMAWERRNGDNIQAWKNIQLMLNAGADDPDLCNIESFRPHTTPTQLAMDGAQIMGKQFFTMGQGEPAAPAGLTNEQADSMFPNSIMAKARASIREEQGTPAPREFESIRDDQVKRQQALETHNADLAREIRELKEKHGYDEKMMDRNGNTADPVVHVTNDQGDFMIVNDHLVSKRGKRPVGDATWKSITPELQ